MSDYWALQTDLKKHWHFILIPGGKGDPTILQEQAVQLMLEKLEVVSQMYHGFEYETYFEADTSKKCSMILAAEEHILGLQDGKTIHQRSNSIVKSLLRLQFRMTKQWMQKTKFRFFPSEKARLAKFDGTGSGRTDEEIETTIRQVIDKKALYSNK